MVLLLWIVCVCVCVCVCHIALSVMCSLVVISWERAALLAHVLTCMWYFLVFLSLFHTVYWVRCGTWLYQFLIFTFFLTLWSWLLYLIYWLISYLAYLLNCCTVPDKRCLSHGMCLYKVMMTLHILNDVANEAGSTQKSKITSLLLVWRMKQWVNW